MTQSWHGLLFAHWTIDIALVRAHVPPHFELDLFDDRAWIGVVPFYMTNVSPRGVPALPLISEFAELNVSPRSSRATRWLRSAASSARMRRRCCILRSGRT
jgi:uncharacterized protein YqjF (DUF2071 family)